MKELEQIMSLVNTTRLTKEDKKNLNDFLGHSKKVNLIDTLALFKFDPTWIERINRNYKAKKQAAERHDITLWNKIIREEFEILSSIKNEIT